MGFAPLLDGEVLGTVCWRSLFHCEAQINFGFGQVVFLDGLDVVYAVELVGEDMVEF